MNKALQYLNSKKWTILMLAALGAVYLSTNFVLFSELLHACIKVFGIAVVATALRSLAFPKTMGSYAFSETLISDLNCKDCDTTLSYRRLRHYWVVTTICYAVTALMFLLA